MEKRKTNGIRKRFLSRALILFFIIVAIGAFTAFRAQNFDDVARVFYPRRPAPEEVASANELARVLRIMTGYRVVVEKEPLLLPEKGFYVGNTRDGREMLPEILAKPPLGEARKLAAFDPNPIRLFQPLPPERWDNVGWCAAKGRVAIAGTDGMATQLAVSLFLQRELGVRWWMPGGSGEDIPRRDAIDVSSIEKTIVRPSYYSRQMAGLSGSEGSMWGVHNLLRGHISMSHSLPRLIDRDVAEKHPDWFPSFSGKPFDPSKWKNHLPHPIFTKPEVGRFVANRVVEFFETHPGVSTFSISPADTSLFGDMDAYAQIINRQDLFRGRLDLSNAVFTFYNAVAKACAEKYPDRYLGALAYSFYENVPDFPVERNIIPFLTADRSQWYDPAFRNEDINLVKKWVSAGPRIIGTWDYYYGYPYLVPRVMTGYVKDSIPTLYNIGVRAFFCELYPIWGYDAPKAWMAARLLWDAGANPDALENEFFTGYFGAAANPMRQFYDKCDAVWNAQKGPAVWIKYYGDADQALLFSTEDLHKLRAFVDEALALAPGSRIRGRVQFVSDDLRVTEVFCAAYPAWDRVARWTPDRGSGELLDALASYRDARKNLENIGQSEDGTAVCDIPQSFGYLTDDDPLAGRLALVANSLDRDAKKAVASLVPEYAGLLWGTCTRLAGEPFTTGLDGWTIGSWPEPVQRYSVGSDGSLAIEKANSLSFQKTYHIRSGKTYSSAFRASGNVSAASTVRLLLEFLDQNGRQISFSADRLPVGELDDALLAVAGKAPGGSVCARISIIVRGQQEGDAVSIKSM